MFFFIGGIQPKTVTVDKQARTCPSCGHVEVYLKRVDHYMSLFFIPLFPVKRGAPFLICENCNTIIDEHGYSTGAEWPMRGKRCPSCGRKVDRDFTFCPYCGKAL
ncbi:MAG TPA: zinc-ribbon domain-containing protein [Desulfobacteraceae bacterium]|nr:zinc-ribbon domain-containing protein [Desulfobacteraceae bacterium]